MAIAKANSTSIKQIEIQRYSELESRSLVQSSPVGKKNNFYVERLRASGIETPELHYSNHLIVLSLQGENTVYHRQNGKLRETFCQRG